jgi:hypothetical protein
MGETGRQHSAGNGFHEGRIEMGLSHAQLGDITGFDSSPVGRWQHLETPASAAVAQSVQTVQAGQALPANIDALAERVARLELDLVALRESLRERRNGSSGTAH